MDELDDLLDPGIRNTNSSSNVQAALPHANAVLVLGIISIVGCFFWGIPGLICGIISLALFPKDKRTYDSNPQRYENSYKNSKAGMVCAVIGTSLSFVTFMILLFAILQSL